MDAKYFREKAELCLRLADGLSLNNPGRFQLMDLAEDFRERAKELEAQDGVSTGVGKLRKRYHSEECGIRQQSRFGVEFVYRQ
jgi:hypothetical protein